MGFDATEIGAEANNTSMELNELVSEKRVIKIQGRPVYFKEIYCPGLRIDG